MRFSSAVTVWPYVRVCVRMCHFFLCIIFATLCVCKQGGKMLSTWSLSKHALTLAHAQTTAPRWVRGDNEPTGGKQSAEVYREEERGNALWFGLFCDPDSAWKAEGEWWCHYSLPSGATHMHTHSVCLTQWKGCSLVPFVHRDQETHRFVRAHIHPQQGWGETPFGPQRAFYTRPLPKGAGPARARTSHLLLMSYCCTLWWNIIALWCVNKACVFCHSICCPVSQQEQQAGVEKPRGAAGRALCH